MSNHRNWRFTTMVAVVVGLLAVLALTPTAQAQEGTSTLKVDLNGTWYKDITVELYVSDGVNGTVSNQLWTKGNQHGASRTYSINPGTYDVRLVQGGQSWIQDDLVCGPGICEVTGFKQTLTLDLSGTWYKDISVQLNMAGGANIWTVGNQHGATRTYNVLAGKYDVVLTQGPQSKTIVGIDCQATSCSPPVPRKTLTVDLSGTWYKDISVALYKDNNSDPSAETLLWTVGNQHGATRTYNVLEGTYDVVLIQGLQSNTIPNVVCTTEAPGADTCVAKVPSAILTVDLSGTWYKDISVQLKITGSGEIWTVGNQHGATRTYNVLDGTYDVVLTQGSQSNTIPNVVCTTEAPGADPCVATVPRKILTVDLSGTWYKDISVQLNMAGGEKLWAVGNQHGATRTYNVLDGTYDVVLTQGVQNNTIGGIDCQNANCSADVPHTILNVDLSGTWYKDISVQLNRDGGETLWTVGNQHGANREYNVLEGKYDVVLTQGTQTHSVSSIQCTPAVPCSAGDVVADLPLDLRLNLGGSVTTSLYDSTGISIWSVGNQHGAERHYNVLKATYDVVVTAAGKDYRWEDVNCLGEVCVLGNSTLTVDFTGINSVHAYIYKSDNKPNLITGPQVAQQTWKDNTASFGNLPSGLYDVKLVKGSQTKIIDNVIVLGTNPVLNDIVTTLTVKFPGISSVHTYVRTTDGAAVDERTWKNDEVPITVLKGTYNVVVVKGAQQIIKPVDCSGDTCVVENIVAQLKVEFPGITGVHTYVKTTNGAAVDERTYQNTGSTTIPVLKAQAPEKSLYKVVVVKGAQQNTYDVDCSTGICTINGIVSTFTLHFPGKSSVHVYLKLNDGNPGTYGAAVDERTYQKDKATFTALKGTYDVLVRIGNESYVLDAVDLNKDTSVYTLTIVKLLNSKGTLIATATPVDYYGGTWKPLGTTTNGVLSVALPGAPANYSFRMNYAGARQEKWQNLAKDPIVIFQTVNVTMELRDSSTSLIKGTAGPVQYYTGTWLDFGDNDTLEDGQVTMELLPLNYSFRMSYAGARQEKWHTVTPTSSVVTFNTVRVTMELRDSSLEKNLITGTNETVQYYTGTWRDFGTGDTLEDGQVKMELLPLNYSFRMSYAGARQEKWQNVATSPVVTFQTVSVTMELRDSSNKLIIGTTGPVQYYTGTWHDFGAANDTMENGQVTMELLPLQYSFRMSYAGARQEKWHTVTPTSSVVTFNTVLVTMELRDSSNKLITGTTETVQYYTGTWHDFGTGDTLEDDGQVMMELLPLNYSFRMSYAGARQEKWQHVGSNATVTFQTGQVNFNTTITPTPTRYYTGTWRTFNNNMQLLPGNYLFDFANIPDKYYTIAGGKENNINP